VRRVYLITDIGEAYLDLWVEALEQYRRTLDNFSATIRVGGQRTSEEEDR
jgi:DNA-binding PadR family transcriptional regulator